LKKILEASSFPFISVDLVNRFWDLDGAGDIPVDSPRRVVPTRLTPELLKQYDQVWFFGQHMLTADDDPNQIRYDDPNEKVKLETNAPTVMGRRHAPDPYGYKDSALIREERDALEDWMNQGGGVLILGDHSNHPLDPKGYPVSTLLYNLGRALGQDVRRAGEMRVWVGPLSGSGYAGNGIFINTSGDTEDMVWMPKQEDSVPQNIFPKFWDLVIPWLGLAERIWHPLFEGYTDIIRIMPDHGHEGVVHIPPDLSDTNVWPTFTGFDGKTYQPQPEIVARGTNQKDWMFQMDAVSAYDGQLAGVGRIVAHTTFHHFINVNLHYFRLPDGSPGETLQIISQYFLNLASYLMPHRLRARALGTMLQSVNNSSNMRDLAGAPLGLIGGAAFQALGKTATQGQIHDLINLAVEAAIPAMQDNVSLQLGLPRN